MNDTVNCLEMYEIILRMMFMAKCSVGLIWSETRY